MRRGILLAFLLAAASSGQAQQAGSAAAAAPSSGGEKPYGNVIDGTKVNELVMDGFRTWRAAACDRCHGANQEGLVGPSLIVNLKSMSKADFAKTITEGRVEKGMPSWKESPNVMQNMDALYAYLKGRSDGAITKARVEKQP